MKVYIVMYNIEYEANEIRGVFDCLEKAEKFAYELIPKVLGIQKSESEPREMLYSETKLLIGGKYGNTIEVLEYEVL